MTAANSEGAGAFLKLMNLMDQELQGLPLDYTLVLMSIMNRPGLSLSDLSSIHKLTDSKTSRVVARLSPEYYDNHTRTRVPGLGLVVTRPDPKNPRGLVVHLTPRGGALSSRVEGIMRGA